MFLPPRNFLDWNCYTRGKATRRRHRGRVRLERLKIGSHIKEHGEQNQRYPHASTRLPAFLSTMIYQHRSSLLDRTFSPGFCFCHFHQHRISRLRRRRARFGRAAVLCRCLLRGTDVNGDSSRCAPRHDVRSLSSKRSELYDGIMSGNGATLPCETDETSTVTKACFEIRKVPPEEAQGAKEAEGEGNYNVQVQLAFAFCLFSILCFFWCLSAFETHVVVVAEVSYVSPGSVAPLPPSSSSGLGGERTPPVASASRTTGALAKPLVTSSEAACTTSLAPFG